MALPNAFKSSGCGGNVISAVGGCTLLILVGVFGFCAVGAFFVDSNDRENLARNNGSADPPGTQKKVMPHTSDRAENIDTNELDSDSLNDSNVPDLVESNGKKELSASTDGQARTSDQAQQTNDIVSPKDGTEPFRIWRSASNKFEVEAAYRYATGDIVALERKDDGKIVKVDISNLSDEDQTYVRETRRKRCSGR